jgi:hypothetical protein
VLRIHYIAVGPSRNRATWAQPADLTHPKDGGSVDVVLDWIAEQGRAPFAPLDQDRLRAVLTTGTTGHTIQGRLELQPAGLERRPTIVGRFILEVHP